LLRTTKKFHLICTADERAWKFDRPVLFLGEWCRLYKRKRIWEGMDAIVSAPYGVDQATKDHDFMIASDLKEKIFPIFCDVLNKHHKSTYSNRFWQIVLGHWFDRVIDVIINRVNTFLFCFENYQITGTTLYINQEYSLACTNSQAACLSYGDARWDSHLSMRILQFLKFDKFTVEICKEEDNSPNFFKVNLSRPQRPIYIQNIYSAIKRVSNLFSRNRDAFLINTYLPRKTEIFLQIILGQFPQKWDSPCYEIRERVNLNQRNNLSIEMMVDEENLLHKIIKELLFELLPICYLEGFSNQIKRVQKLSWPHSPKFIFTSNNFDTDEIFKLWTAIKVESGVRYFVGQHGALYGVSRYWYNHSIEELTADKFLTWGWKGRLHQHIPAFILKAPFKKKARYKKCGGLLLIELHQNYRIKLWDDIADFTDYFESQKKLVSNLNFHIKNELIIRLHSSWKKMQWSEMERWRDFDPSLKIDEGDSKLSALIEQSRLIIHSYDSTGVLETLSKNIPTLIFLHDGLGSIREEAKPFYQKLIDVGILYCGADTMAEHINKIWGNIEEWWSDGNLQEARILFCKQYAVLCDDPIKSLKRILAS